MSDLKRSAKKTMIKPRSIRKLVGILVILGSLGFLACYGFITWAFSGDWHLGTVRKTEEQQITTFWHDFWMPGIVGLIFIVVGFAIWRPRIAQK